MKTNTITLFLSTGIVIEITRLSNKKKERLLDLLNGGGPNDTKCYYTFKHEGSLYFIKPHEVALYVLKTEKVHI